jgi:WhiB family redox-sensing transcriptional regulator
VTGIHDPAWRDRAACARPGVDPEVFFPNRDEIIKQRTALRICAGCPVQTDCLNDALSHPAFEDHGIRGGLTRDQRMQLRARSRRQRQPRRRAPRIDPAFAAQAFELARQVGTVRAAEQLGINRRRLYEAWDRLQLGRPIGPRGSRFLVERSAAEEAFRLADQLGVKPAARQLGTSASVLHNAWDHWGLGRPDTSAAATHRRRKARAQRAEHPFEQLTRLDVAQATQRQTNRDRVQRERGRER